MYVYSIKKNKGTEIKMKTVTNRIIAMTLSLVICFSLAFSVSLSTQAATVDYVYAGNYIKNWGVRGTVATFLSPNAIEFYEDNNTSYDELSALSGSSNNSSVMSSSLYGELQRIMKKNHSNVTSYNETRDKFQYTDCQNSGKTSNKISSFYSGKLIGPSWDGGATWNREHTWPNSKGSGDGENDIMMLRPTSMQENSGRGNKAYGESSGFYNPNKESGNTLDLRGDVARIMVYQYVRWSQSSLWGASGVMESKAVLLKWMEADPVDTWELGRNDSVESITGTRNVFVDYPELVFILFGAEVPSDYQTPSGEAKSQGSGSGSTPTPTPVYTVTATSSNTSWGTVSVNGMTITADPTSDYMVDGYTIVSGSATVSRNGNSFVVTPTSNVTIRVNFVKKSEAQGQSTVIFSDDGNQFSSQKVNNGSKISVPEYQGQLPREFTFIGWSERTVNGETAEPQLYREGDKYEVTSNVTLYAVFAMSKDNTYYYYTSIPTDCTHSRKQNVASVEATCFTFGYTAGVYCPDCDKYLSGHQIIETLAHTYADEKATKCDVCGAIKGSDSQGSNNGSSTPTTDTIGSVFIDLDSDEYEIDWVLVGIIAGGVLLAAGITVLVIVLVKKKKSKNNQ